MENFSQSQRERLNFIDFRLFFTGEIGRNDLIKRFGIKEAAATRDITLYRQIAPKNVVYDTTSKIYKIADTYKRHFIKDVQAKDLLLAVVHGIGDGSGTLISEPIIPCELPTRLHVPRIEPFAQISRAIYNQNPVKIHYFSQNSGESIRTIVPFAIAGNGLRWHVRAFDRKKGAFRDFVINRITKLEILSNELAKNEETSNFDCEWNQFVNLEIVPHPLVEHKESVEIEYNMEGGKLLHPVRAAMAAYVLRLWNVDCSSQPIDNPNFHHLWLKNVNEIKEKASLDIAPRYAKN